MGNMEVGIDFCPKDIKTIEFMFLIINIFSALPRIILTLT